METQIPTIALSGLTALAMLTAASLRGWHGWLALKHRELEAAGSLSGDTALPHSSSMTARIEIADLKERLRKLEAIAAGVDL
jgi:hypothetical protein